MSLEVATEVGRLWEPINRIANILTASQKDLFIKLPALEAYFPMSLVGLGGLARNHGEGVDLQMTGTVTAGYDGNSYRQLGGGVNYLAVTDGAFNLTGLETYIEAALRGFTIGGWFKLDSTVAATRGMITKDGIAANRGYAMAYNSTDNPILIVSSNGAATFSVVSTGQVTVGQWHFLVARFHPSVELAIFLDSQKTVNVTAIPASCFASTQAFEVGRQLNSDTRIPTAKVRDVFISRAILSDELIEEVRLASVP